MSGRLADPRMFPRLTRASVEQCCSALHLVTQFFHHLIPSMTSQELRQHLALSSNWPEVSSSNTKQHVDGDAIVRTLIEVLMSSTDGHVES